LCGLPSKGKPLMAIAPPVDAPALVASLPSWASPITHWFQGPDGERVACHVRPEPGMECLAQAFTFRREGGVWKLEEGGGDILVCTADTRID
jgi:hypothetical protein